MKVSQSSPEKPFHYWGAIAVLIIVPFLLYWPSIRAPFIFDDITYIVENPKIKSLTLNSQEKSYEQEQSIVEKIAPSRRLTFFSFALNYRLNGINPFGYHLFNLCVHVINILLVFFLATILLADPQLAFLTALLFAVHPMNTEVVSYISHRSESLAAMFYLISVISFAKASKGKPLTLFLSLMSFILGFLCKEIIITLPLALLVLDYLVLSKVDKKPITARWKSHAPFWIAAGILLLYRSMAMGGVKDYADATLLRWSQQSYVMVQPIVIWRYIQLLFIPMNQCIDHYILPFKTASDWRFIVPTLGLFALCPIIIYFLKKDTADFRRYTLSILWFLIILLPTSVLPINDAMTERRVYLSAFGFVIFIVSLLSNMTNRRTASAILLAYVVFLSSLTWKRNLLYAAPIGLWEEAIARYPNNDRAYYNLGVLYNDAKDISKTSSAFERAIKLNPNNDRAYYNLGTLQNDSGNRIVAEQLFRETIRHNPNNAKAYGNLGFILALQGKTDEALQTLKSAVRLNPNDSKSFNTLGSLFQQKGDYPNSEKSFLRAIQLNENFQEAHFNLGLLYLIGKDFTEATLHFKKALELKPDDREAMKYIDSMALHPVKASNTHVTWQQIHLQRTIP